MTILYPQSFNRMRPAGFDGVFDWDWFLPVFAGTGITPMDLDCLIERSGFFLVFETKQPGVDIPFGQRLALERLIIACHGRVRVVTIKAKCPEEITGWETWTLASDSSRVIRVTHLGNADDLRQRIDGWFKQASSRPLPPIWNKARPAADLFKDLISDPVEAATVYLQRLTPDQLACVFDRFVGFRP